jgi:SWI/SNF-related matrix-associated actin-dependent regulator 1 of chromatin subfamily A
VPEPRPYQLAGRDFLAGRRCALLADEMRVGKTPQAILAAHKAGARTMFVVCPAIAVPQWEREIERWWPSGPLPRTKVLSYNRATTLWEAGLKGTVDVFIPDEAHFAKSVDAKRTQMVYGKTGFGAQAGAVWSLSGTPAPKDASELWPMMRAFGVVGMTLEDFQRRYCVIDWQGKVRGTKVEMIPELRALLAKFMLRRTRKEVAPEMPEIGFEFLNVGESFGVDYSAPEDATLEWLEANRNVDVEDRIAVARHKADTLAKEIVFALQNSLLTQTVIFGWHREPLEQLCRDLEANRISVALINGDTLPRAREFAQGAFKRGELQVIAANIATAGTAIDLSAADHGYFLELDWVPGNNAQAANRLVNLQKSSPVTFDVCTMPGTVDDRVQKILLRRVKELATLI